MKTFLLILFSSSILISQTSFDAIPIYDSYKLIDRMMQKVYTLASPEFGGRLPGSDGYNKASEYAKEHFKNLGLFPAFDGDYYQKLFVEYNEIKSPAKFFIIKDNTNIVEYQIGKDFAFRGFTGSGEITAPVVFCGYGVASETYNDYKGVDVKGKIVMVFKQNPSWKPDNINFGNGYPREKARIAFDRGAVGIIFVSKPLDKNPQPVIGSVMHGGGNEQNEKFPQLQISLEVTDDFLHGAGFSIEELQSRIDESKKPFSIELPVKAKIQVNAQYSSEKISQNIGAILEGRDPELKNEFIVVGAHLDHVGSQGDEVYYPGANDNASGSAAVMQMAEVFTKAGVRPKRSILFLLFTGEEQGLLGSEYFVQNSPVDLSRIVAMFNLDCIGSGDSIQIGGGKSWPKLWDIFRQLDNEGDKLMIESTWAGGGADATPFFKKEIPTAYIVSYYSYTNLHQPSDLPENINTDLYESIYKLTTQALLKVAEGEYGGEKLVK